MSEFATHQKFSFDNVFDEDSDVVFASARPKRLYPADEVETIRAAAHAEGERAAMANVAAQQAQALADIAQACRSALPALAAVAHNHREGSADLALACARAIADAALDRFPEAPLRAALAALAREIETAPRLVVHAAVDLQPGLAAALAETTQAIGYAGVVQLRDAPGRALGAFSLDFGDGAADYDPQGAAARVAAALDAALAAEGLHAEPIALDQESTET